MTNAVCQFSFILLESCYMGYVWFEAMFVYWLLILRDFYLVYHFTLEVSHSLPFIQLLSQNADRDRGKV